MHLHFPSPIFCMACQKHPYLHIYERKPNGLHVLFHLFYRHMQSSLCKSALCGFYMCCDVCALFYFHEQTFHKSSPECECEVKMSLHFRCNIEVAYKEKRRHSLSYSLKQQVVFSMFGPFKGRKFVLNQKQDPGICCS